MNAAHSSWGELKKRSIYENSSALAALANTWIFINVEL